MGYTHYWSINRDMTQDEVTGILTDVKAILAATDVPLGDGFGEGEPVLRESVDREPHVWFVALNGVGQDGCETFKMASVKRDFDFCKTRRRPYDVVVTALLIAVADRCSGIEYSSDGDYSDWQAGLELAQRATGRNLSVHFN